MGRAARNPADADLQWFENIERRVAALERRSPLTIRFTAADGAYAIVGVQPDGTVGVRTYDNTGALVGDYTAT